MTFNTLPPVKLDYSIFSHPNSTVTGKRFIEEEMKKHIRMLATNWEPFLNNELCNSGFKNPDQVKELIGEESYQILLTSVRDMFYDFLDERKPQPRNTMEIIMYESFLKATKFLEVKK